MNITDILRNKLLNTIKSRTVYENDCWLYFPTNTTTGYGDIIIEGRVHGVHRISASMFLGLDLDDKNLQVNHKPICKNRNCWNPDHIYIGTHADNMKDMREDNCRKCGSPKHGIKWNKMKLAFYKYCKNCSNEMNRLGAARRRKSSKSNKKDL